jgi:hypothetical protein
MAYEERETGNLIGSDKVEGTAVYGADNQRIGSIERVMIDKISGQIAYAVLGFGGFLGIGDDHYPLPWQSLKYDTNVGGDVTGITDSQQANPKAEGRYKGRPGGYRAQCRGRQPARGRPLLELRSGHDRLQPRHRCEGG